MVVCNINHCENQKNHMKRHPYKKFYSLLFKQEIFLICVILSSKYFADCVPAIKASIDNTIFSDANWTSRGER